MGRWMPEDVYTISSPVSLNAQISLKRHFIRHFVQALWYVCIHVIEHSKAVIS